MLPVSGKHASHQQDDPIENDIKTNKGYMKESCSEMADAILISQMVVIVRKDSVLMG